MRKMNEIDIQIQITETYRETETERQKEADRGREENRETSSLYLNFGCVGDLFSC